MTEDSPTRSASKTLPEQMHLVRTQMEELQRDVLEEGDVYYRFAFNGYFKHIWEDTDQEEGKRYLVTASKRLADVYAKASASAAQWVDAMEEASKNDPNEKAAPAAATTANERHPR